jgi:hypothetical protein
MKHLKPFNEGLTYSGGDVTKMPVIGTITTRELKMWDDHVIPEGKDDVVEIIEDKGMKIYVVNRWYKGRIPQLVHEDMVKKYEPK